MIPKFSRPIFVFLGIAVFVTYFAIQKKNKVSQLPLEVSKTTDALQIPAPKPTVSPVFAPPSSKNPVVEATNTPPSLPEMPKIEMPMPPQSTLRIPKNFEESMEIYKKKIECSLKCLDKPIGELAMECENASDKADCARKIHTSIKSCSRLKCADI